jgi:hypothetical protein
MRAILTKRSIEVSVKTIKSRQNGYKNTNLYFAFNLTNILSQKVDRGTLNRVAKKGKFFIYYEDWYELDKLPFGQKPKSPIYIYKLKGDKFYQYCLITVTDEIDRTVDDYVIAEQLSNLQNYVFCGTLSECKTIMENTPSYGYGNDTHNIYHYEDYCQIQLSENRAVDDDYDDDYDDD